MFIHWLLKQSNRTDAVGELSRMVMIDKSVDRGRNIKQLEGKFDDDVLWLSFNEYVLSKGLPPIFNT